MRRGRLVSADASSGCRRNVAASSARLKLPSLAITRLALGAVTRMSAKLQAHRMTERHSSSTSSLPTLNSGAPSASASRIPVAAKRKV